MSFLASQEIPSNL